MKPPFPRSKSHSLATSREKVRRARAVAIRRLGVEPLELRVLFAGLSIESDQPLIEVEESPISDDAALCGIHAPVGSENQETTDRCLADWHDPAAADETVDSAKTGNDWEYTPDSELVFHRTPTQGPAIETYDPFYGPPEEWWFDASTNQSSPGFSGASTDVGAEITLPLTLPAIQPPVPSAESLPASLRGTTTVSSELSSNRRVGVGETVTSKPPNADLPASSRLSETDRYFGQQQPRALTWSLRSEPSHRSTLNLSLLEMDDLGLAGPSNTVRPVAGPLSAEQTSGGLQSIRLSRSNSRSVGENPAASDLRRLLARNLGPDQTALPDQSLPWDLGRALNARNPLAESELLVVPAGVRVGIVRGIAAGSDASLEPPWGVARVAVTGGLGERAVFFVSQAAGERPRPWQVLRPTMGDSNVKEATLVPVSLDDSTPAAMFELAKIPQSVVEFSASSDRWSLLWAASTFAIVQIVWERRRAVKETPEASPEKPDKSLPLFFRVFRVFRG